MSLSVSNRKRPARRACAVAVIAALCATGCALVWKPTDTAGQKAAKLTGRVPLAIVTLGLSEVVIGRETEREAQWKAQGQQENRRKELREEMLKWQNAALSAKGDPEQRELAKYFYESARDQLVKLDAQEGGGVGARR